MAEINHIISPRGKGETEARKGGNRFLIKRWVGVLSSEASAHPLSIEISLGDGAGEISAPYDFSGTSPPKARGTPRLGRRRPVRGWTWRGWGCGLRWGSPEPGRRPGGGRGARVEPG